MRKGPEHLPRSWLVFLLSFGSMLVASFSAMVLVEALAKRNYLLTLATNLVGILVYAAVLVVAGRTRRMLQTLTSVLGCGAILTLLFAAEFTLFRPVLGPGLAGIIATLIIFWSVPVEGHIISRAIDRHWYLGIAIAIAVFILQVGFQSMFVTRS